MSKLYWRYGCVRAGKTTELLRVADNYKRQGKEVRVWKPAMDTRDGDRTVSRLGMSQKVDLLIQPALENFPERLIGRVDCILIDEAQFLTPANVDGIRNIPTKLGIPVICYGLRADFHGHLFHGAARLFAVADAIEEIKTTCIACNRKALYNALADEGDVLAKPPTNIDRARRKTTGVPAPVILGHGFLPTCHKHWNG